MLSFNYLSNVLMGLKEVLKVPFSRWLFFSHLIVLASSILTTTFFLFSLLHLFSSPVPLYASLFPFLKCFLGFMVILFCNCLASFSPLSCCY